MIAELLNAHACATQRRSSAGQVERWDSIAAGMKMTEPVAVARKIDPGRRRAAAKRIAANIRRLQRSRTTRTAARALAEARGERLAR